MSDKVMDDGVEVLAGPFDTREAAWVELEERINPEGWSGLHTPKAAKGHDGKWYVVKDPTAKHIHW